MITARAMRTRNAVEAAALELFVQKGFEGASIDEIARRAKVSKPTIYAHYHGKEDLFVKILERCCTRLLTPILDDDPTEKTLEEVLLDFAIGYCETVLSQEVIALHRLFISEAARFPLLGQRYYAAGPQEVHNELAAFFRRRQSEGQMEAADANLQAEQFAGLVLTPIRLKRLFSVTDDVDQATIRRYCMSAVSLFCEGVRRR